MSLIILKRTTLEVQDEEQLVVTNCGADRIRRSGKCANRSHIAISGVDVALIEVSRTGPETVTVKWEYRNETKAPVPLATNSRSWSDPYRLSWDTYLTDEATNAKFPVLKDSDGHPIAAVHGKTFDKIVLGTVKPLKTWAKYNVPANERQEGDDGYYRRGTVRTGCDRRASSGLKVGRER